MHEMSNAFYPDSLVCHLPPRQGLAPVRKLGLWDSAVTRSTLDGQTGWAGMTNTGPNAAVAGAMGSGG